MEIRASGVSDLYQNVLWWAKVADHEVEVSRNGSVRTMADPLTICNLNPKNRVLLNKRRNANPFFQCMEAIWMFAGSNNDWITQFNKQMKEYMDYGSFHGAYGWRWTTHFDLDQISGVIEMLKKTPNTRRAYVSLWDPRADLGMDYKDLPCNVGMAFQVRDGRLNGYVFNRSNDLIWGMLGTNCVHFSMLLEVVAHCAYLPLGSLYQTTINPHIYQLHWPLLENPYSGVVMGDRETVDLNPLSYVEWCDDARKFIKHGDRLAYRHWWFGHVASPMYAAYINKDKDALGSIAAPDWREACEIWWRTNRG